MTSSASVPKMSDDRADGLSFTAAKAHDPTRFHASQCRGAAATEAYWQRPRPPAWLDCDARAFERWLEQQETDHAD